MLPASERKLKLLDWLEVELPTFFAGRIIAVDLSVADRWGRLLAEANRPCQLSIVCWRLPR